MFVNGPLMAFDLKTFFFVILFIQDPVSDLPDWYYPFYRQFLKFATSFSILIFMVSDILRILLSL